MRVPTLISYITFICTATSLVRGKEDHDHLARLEKLQRRTPTPVRDGFPGHHGHGHGHHHHPSPMPNRQCCKAGFIQMKNGKLQTCRGKPYRFAGFNAPSLLDHDDFSIDDTFLSFKGLGRAVTRIYPLEISGSTPYNDQSLSHITGWDADTGSWKFNEDAMQRFDRVLAAAARHDNKIIFPIINQDFGSGDKNWKGNYVDLIIHRYAKGWDYAQAQKNVDFFTDRTMIDSYKILLTGLINRVNTVTGVRYGDDSSILAWETGNEMAWQHKGKVPAPAAWTIEIAKHIKSLAPCALVMDGSFSKSDTSESAFRTEVLESKDIDLMSYHYYGSGDTKRVVKDSAIAASHGKVFICGEYGFLAKGDMYAPVLETARQQPGFGGSLVWGFRPHSSKGGFITHSEGDEMNWSYHVPGWPNSQISEDDFDLPTDWDKKEATIVDAIRKASFAINDEEVRKYPRPNAPEVSLQGPNNITWTGSAWATTYEIYGSRHASGFGGRGWKLIQEGVLDVFNAGNLSHILPETEARFITMRGVTLDGTKGRWSNVLGL